ncbi:hypothetical protein GBO22_02535 [Mycobacterium avium subsp. hominissuis]|uniref:hypothetical protein n=1 Tax=Mycobacterium avium TaxID=1764 RepID=UPI001CC3B3B3|nr:hypothetical protein [Mycobacterium avium]MBZ4509116.1 hypothetical protein [Mycobacterium avium subsp. hominissuis]
MKLNGDGDLPVIVVAKREPPRIQIRSGPLRFTLIPDEAIALANALVDATEQLSTEITNPTKEKQQP